MRHYSDYEIEIFIDEIKEAAFEAIEQAAGEAARAAFLLSLDREASALLEAQNWRLEAQAVRKTEIKNKVLVGTICFIGGLVIGVSGTLIIQGR